MLSSDWKKLLSRRESSALHVGCVKDEKVLRHSEHLPTAKQEGEMIIAKHAIDIANGQW
jgi:hypothetical protein